MQPHNFLLNILSNHKRRMGFLILVAFAIAACDSGLAEDRVASSMPAEEIIFSGKIVNTKTGEWPNNRLVILYLKNQEVGRSITKTGNFSYSGEGIHDGLFEIHAKNPYALRTTDLRVDSQSNANFKFCCWPGLTNHIYRWFGNVQEGETLSIPVPSKNVKYVLKIFAGDIATLPSELLVPGSTMLTANNGIVVAPTTVTPQQSNSQNEVGIKNIKYNSTTEILEVNKLTVPLNNCGGSAPLAQDYTYSQTFLHEFTSELGGKLGVGIPLPPGWPTLVVELQAKYGFEQGQVDVRTVSYHMQAQPGTNQVYIITWKEVWESGTAQISNGNDQISMPFRVKTNLIYEVDSKKQSCN